ncbi:uncharacterized protein LOC123524833 isoform X1 [Mercenaria mercenaria]|uniref:uncharacterized protein LOC123524833 isoform X1 n=1 Tax=Mercenaria mercenaria TaxID=6596 RepID=UPI00234EC03D|nr:uncharacterized protein LOC123524833 isoform X1 [Mercenaria mercenaria]
MSLRGRNYCESCTLRTAVVLFGGFLVHLALGAMYTFGNFAPYFISYIRNRTDDTEIRNVDSLWINAAGTIGNCLGLTVGGIFALKFGTRIATFIGAVVFCGSVAASYFTVNDSFIALVLTYGLTGYLGHKLTYGTPVQTAIKWLPEHSTLAAGIIVSGTGGGSLIFNQVITGYINPDNLSPDLTTEDGGRYFTQPELLGRVPTCFLVLGATYFGLQLIGIACLSDPPPNNQQVNSDFGEISKSKSDKLPVELKSYKSKEDVSHEVSGQVAVVHDNLGYKHDERTEQSFAPSATALPDNTMEYENKEVSTEDSIPKELSIMEAIKFALRCRSFYVVWLTIMLMNGGMQFINGLYKAYGLTFIDDDHFLALVGSLAAVFNCIGRPIWGAVMDKTGFRLQSVVYLGDL